MIRLLCRSAALLLCVLFAPKISCASATDTLVNILKISNANVKQKKLVLYLRYYFGDLNPDAITAGRARVSRLLAEYEVEDRTEIEYLITGICEMRRLNLKAAESALIKAIEQSDKDEDHYVLYACFTQLGFLRSYQGNTIEAVNSFRQAKLEANILNDAYLQILICVNISDLYSKNSFYGQAIFHLNQAQAIAKQNNINEPLLINAINNNKAENYFRMGNVDSLKKYHQLLMDAKRGTYRLYIYRKRTAYLVEILNKQYDRAIRSIHALEKDKRFRFDNNDRRNLADAYFQMGKGDSAKAIFNQLLTDPELINHPEAKLHFYRLLGEIAIGQNQNKEAALNFQKALQQAREQIGRLTAVDTVASQIRIDEMQSAYIQKAEAYKRERMWMFFILIISLLITASGIVLYRNIRQKRYYEKLLFDAKKEELAFINSHEVRRHLSNILGIVDMIRNSDDRHEEYMHAEEHLLTAAENLDIAIKNISEKLDA